MAQSTAGNTGMSTASNAVTVNAYTGMGNGTSSTGTGGGDPTTNIHYSGHQWSTPAVQGSYFAGANPCLIGVGASGASGPIGLSFTFGRSDAGCQRRSDAAAWHALGHDDVAIARMCQDDDNRQAFESLGMLCPQNRARLVPAAAVAPTAPPPAAIAATAPVQFAPAPAAVPQPRPMLVASRSTAPDWCTAVTGGAERQHYKQVCGF